MASGFRADINGLRAWAVAAVILYHFGVPGFSGGFVGVDVFFVISGFLMTGIIINGLQRSDLADRAGSRVAHFSIFDFYMARARRIIPALFILCLILMAAGWFWLPFIEYKVLATHVITALLFVSNIKFWKESGYFDSASHEKWLLHTWSLSVEWQFYILLPIVLWAAWRLFPSRKFITWLVISGLVASFAICVFGTYLKPSATFYLLPTRAWEMLAGGLVFLLADKIRLSEARSRFVEAIGLGFILLSIFVFDGNTPWPGWAALIPVSGAVLVLIAARQDSVWTGASAVQWLGSSSYSLYLWHWPVTVILRYMSLENETSAILVGLAVTLILGWLSYRMVETPTRKHLEKLHFVPAMLVFLVGLGVACGLSFVVWQKGGVPGRLSDDIELVAAAVNDKNPRRSECHGNGRSPIKECKYGGENLGIIVFGDSHADAVIRSVEKSLPEKNMHVLDLTTTGGKPIAGVRNKDYGDYPGEFVSALLVRLESDYEQVPLLVVERANSMFEGAPDVRVNAAPTYYIKYLPKEFSDDYRREIQNAEIDTLCRFAKSRPVYVLRMIPEMPVNVPNFMSRAKIFRGEDVRVMISVEEHQKRSFWANRTRDIAAAKCGIKILDPTTYLCDESFCYGDRNGVPSYYDDDHLSVSGADLLIPMFKQVFDERKP